MVNAGDPARFDLLLTGGRVIDPRHRLDAVCDVAVRDGRIAAVAPDLPRANADRVRDARGTCVVPGLVDLHTHVYRKATSYGVDTDSIAQRSAVATMVDAGSAGAGNFAGLREFVIERARTRVLAYLNISFPGIFAFDRSVMAGEAALRELLSVDRCVEVARANTDVVVGIKVRLGGAVSAGVGLEALERAIDAAQAVDLPVMAHIGRPPPSYAEVVDRLRPGDVLTHCFRPAPNAPVDSQRKVLPALRAARARGVLFDVAHGMGAFGFDSAQAAIDDGFAPDVVSSDVHALSVFGPAYDLLHVMSKLLNCGIGFVDVIRMVSDAPARALRRDDLGHLGVGAPADLSLLRVIDVPVPFVDVTGARRDGCHLIRAAGMLRAGQWIDPVPRPWELAEDSAHDRAAS